MLSWCGFYRKLRAAILRRGVHVEGSCRACGRCCRKIVLMDHGRWLHRERDFERLKREESHYERFRITGRTDDGMLTFTCDLLGEDNLCSVHDTRPDLCKTYPAKLLYYRGGILLDDCGYRYVEWTFRDAWDSLLGRKRIFDNVLRRELDKQDENGTDS